MTREELECSQETWKVAVFDAYTEYEHEETFIDAYKCGELYFVHGELDIYCFDNNLCMLWNFSARDIFVTTDGTSAFEIKDNHLLLRDFEGYTYFVDYNGKVIKECEPQVSENTKAELFTLSKI